MNVETSRPSRLNPTSSGKRSVRSQRVTFDLSPCSGGFGQPFTPQPTAPLARGEIVAIYPQDKKILIKHGPIPTLDMGPMTMEFEIANERMAKPPKKGDRVRFAAKQVGDDYVITRIELRK